MVDDTDFTETEKQALAIVAKEAANVYREDIIGVLMLTGAFHALEDHDKAVVRLVQKIEKRFSILAIEAMSSKHPNECGKQLAEFILNKPNIIWSHLTIDLRDVPSDKIISAFIVSFYDTVVKNNPNIKKFLLFIEWQTKFDFQKDNIRTWLRALKENRTTND